MTSRTRLNQTGLPAGAASNTDTTRLKDGWTLIRSEPGQYDGPGDLPADGTWTSASVPGTVAGAVGPDGYDDHLRYDEYDWWYRCTLPPRSDTRPAGATHLRFDGLATLAEVWVNGTSVLHSSNMFASHEVDVTDFVAGDGATEIVIVFRSLEAALSVRRSRPRWKTNLVSHQQLRWHRTTLLGRMPGWTPAIQPVGPWRPVWLEVVTGPELKALDVRSDLVREQGTVTVDALVTTPGGQPPTSALLHVGDTHAPVDIERVDDGWRVHGDLVIDEPTLWWPRTHGEPTLHACHLTVATPDGDFVADCGNVGFRSVEIDRTDGRITFVVNGVPVFCRGACWTTNDIVTLAGSDTLLRETLRHTADANANMVRVGGTMTYESDLFYDECDRLGLMVWQDFMFANMDYPFDDADFRLGVEAEVEQQLRRLGRHASVVAYCGGSEIEQQAAMFGAPRDIWRHDFLANDLAHLVEARTGAPYWSSTPTGGALPFHTGEGLTHYYGVGAYKRPLEDVRLADVKFTPECLGFSNVPEADNLRLLGPGGGAHHHPEWKKGVPRDTGAGWDFEDIRDHYLERLHDVEAVRLRSEDPETYLRLSRTVTGRVMARVFDEWRSSESTCGGGLVWFLKDLRPGAGWGILDSDGKPKPAFHFLRRAWAPVRVAILDRGLDGVRVEIHNESAEPLTGRLEVSIFGAESRLQTESACDVSVPARSSSVVVLEEMLEHFADPTYSYRFGPRRHAAIAARFDSDHPATPATAIYWPSLATPLPGVELEGSIDSSTSTGSVTAASLARDVRIEVRNAEVSENYFDTTPASVHSFRVMRSADSDGPIRAFASASNAPDGTRLVVRD